MQIQTCIRSLKLLYFSDRKHSDDRLYICYNILQQQYTNERQVFNPNTSAADLVSTTIITEITTYTATSL